jgi:hypothetical protein
MERKNNWSKYKSIDVTITVHSSDMIDAEM